MKEEQKEAIRLQIRFGDEAKKVVDEKLKLLSYFPIPTKDRYGFNWTEYYIKVRKEITKKQTGP